MTRAYVLDSKISDVSAVAASVCRNSSVMPICGENCVFAGTPFGVPFFAFTRFFGFAFYYFCFITGTQYRRLET